MAKNIRKLDSVQYDVKFLAEQDRSWKEINEYLTDKYGRSYRKQNLLEDIRKYKDKKLDAEKARKAIPIKYRKELDIREHILGVHVTYVGDAELVKVKPSEGEISTYIEIIKEWIEDQKDQKDQKKAYGSLDFFLGTKENLEGHLDIISKSENIASYFLIHTAHPAKVFSAITKVILSSSISASWVEKLVAVGNISSSKSFKNSVNKLKGELD